MQILHPHRKMFTILLDDDDMDTRREEDEENLVSTHTHTPHTEA